MSGIFWNNIIRAISAASKDYAGGAGTQSQKICGLNTESKHV